MQDLDAMAARLSKARRRKSAKARARRDGTIMGFARADGTYVAAPRTSRAEAQAALARVIEMDRAGEFGE